MNEYTLDNMIEDMNSDEELTDEKSDTISKLLNTIMDESVARIDKALDGNDERWSDLVALITVSAMNINPMFGLVQGNMDTLIKLVIGIAAREGMLDG